MARVNCKTNGCGRYAPTLRALADDLKISYSSAKDLKRDGLILNGRGYSLAEARKFLSIRSLRARDLAGDPDGVALKKRRLQLDIELRQMDLELARNLWVRKERRDCRMEERSNPREGRV